MLHLFTCCASRLTDVERASIRRIQLTGPSDPVKSTMYSDSTSQGAMQAASSLGLVGALVGGGIAAADIHSGVTRWASVTQGHAGLVPQSVRDRLRDYFGKEAHVQLSAAPGGDATMVISNMNYGVMHAGDQQFKAVVFADIEMNDRNGKYLWSYNNGSGTSMIVLTQQQFATQPAAYTAALKEACDHLASNAVLADQGITPVTDVRSY